jgi:hypothetical protein
MNWSEQEIKEFVSRKLAVLTNMGSGDIASFLRSIIFSSAVVDWKAVGELVVKNFPECAVSHFSVLDDIAKRLYGVTFEELTEKLHKKRCLNQLETTFPELFALYLKS